MTLAFASFVISPSVTFDPATFPTYATLNISSEDISDSLVEISSKAP